MCLEAQAAQILRKYGMFSHLLRWLRPCTGCLATSRAGPAQEGIIKWATRRATTRTWSGWRRSLPVASWSSCSAARTFVPNDFGVYGHYRASALDDARARPIAFAGQAACVECHSDIGEFLRKTARHARVSCESCHGPLATHAAGDEPLEPAHPDGTSTCVGCHLKSRSKPTTFPRSRSPIMRVMPGASSATTRTPRRSPEEPNMDESRRQFLLGTGRLLVLTGAASLAWDAIMDGASRRTRRTTR